MFKNQKKLGFLFLLSFLHVYSLAFSSFQIIHKIKSP